MRRYRNLNNEEIYEAFNKVRDAFLAAKDGHEVNQIIDGLLTHDEKLKIGRRILIANYLLLDFTMEDIVRELKVGMNTIMHVSRRLEKYKECFDLIHKRSKHVQDAYEQRKYRLVGGSTKILKTKEYTGFTRKDVKRK